jgi:hypothetical protein
MTAQFTQEEWLLATGATPAEARYWVGRMGYARACDGCSTATPKTCIDGCTASCCLRESWYLECQRCGTILDEREGRRSQLLGLCIDCRTWRRDQKREEETSW